MYERYETFTTAIVKIHRCIHKIKSEVMAEFHLKSPHVSCLYYLGRGDGMTATDICELSAEDKSSISRSVDYLEEHGYITCASDAKKRYKAHLSLTDKGRAVAKRMEEKIAQVLAKSNVGLTEEAQAVFYDALLSICNNLQKICNEY